MSPKYIDFINTVHGVRADFLEGTTASGKTTVGAGVKFMRMVSLSDKKMHILASRTTGTAEKNIIQQDNGILDLHRGAVYNGNGSAQFKFPHILFEDKVIYVLGYDTRDKWENVLGGQYGCVYIDEINTANIEFVREISTRNDYLMATLNPDDPNLPIYKEFINRSRPYQKYAHDVPPEIMAELTEEPVPQWRYWFFTFRDNLSLTEADIQRKIEAAAPRHHHGDRKAVRPPPAGQGSAGVFHSVQRWPGHGLQPEESGHHRHELPGHHQPGALHPAG